MADEITCPITSWFIVAAFFYHVDLCLITAVKWKLIGQYIKLGPVVQSIISLTSSLVVKMLTVLISTISNSQVFLLKNCEWLLQIYFFSKNISIYAILNDQSFNDTLSTNIVRLSFEWLGPPIYRFMKFNSHSQSKCGPSWNYKKWSLLSWISSMYKQWLITQTTISSMGLCFHSVCEQLSFTHWWTVLCPFRCYLSCIETMEGL